MPKLKKYYFTFGYQHTHPKSGELMRDYWIEITSSNEGRARKIMSDRYGLKWASSYIDRDFKPEFFPKGCYEVVYDCDHIVGLHYHFELLITQSEMENYNPKSKSIKKFNYCPTCGVKLELDNG